MSYRTQGPGGGNATPAPPSFTEWGGRDKVILVPLDGSLEAKTALPVARLIANITGGAIHILHVADHMLPHRQLLQQLKLRRREETIGLIVDQVVGTPAETIARRASEKQVTLIVMTTRGELPYEGHILRPVPEYVLHEAPCPVLLVRPEISRQVARMKQLRRLLLPLDGAPSTMAVIGPAVGLARTAGAHLDVLYVAALYQQAAEEPGTLTTPRYVDQPQYEWPAWAQEYLDRFHAVVGDYAPETPTRMFVRHGTPEREILSFAVREDSDLIVLEWRGRWDPTHAGVVKAVLADAPCPVLLLRTQPA